MSDFVVKDMRDAMYDGGMSLRQQADALAEIERLAWELRLERAVSKRRMERIFELTGPKIVAEEWK